MSTDTPGFQHLPAPASEPTGIEIAIVGMAARFPGAEDVDAYWRNIRDGVTSVVDFSDEQLRRNGVPQHMLDDPEYVKSGVMFHGFDQFDAGFFGYTPREAENLDPQQRIFLECAWASLEHAGCDMERWPGKVGVYAGEGTNLYLMRNLLPAFTLGAGSGIAELLGLMNGNASSSLCTRVAYKLDLRGPAVAVQTACSTSLAAVHIACQALLNHECDMALAGGVWLNLLQESGYRYQAGAILSPDGHCRAFDAEAAGTTIGSGAGVVVLKRLDDALRDNDTIHAVIKGSAMNNDGANKVGFTAPGIDGQAEAIRTAQLIAGVAADTIGYVETHGTGTVLGDPIELAALTQAFRLDTQRCGYCAIGSVKTGIGHLDAAAGVAGLIKAAQALKYGILPPSLNFRNANPQIDFGSTPFYVNTQARPWPQGPAPRRAGVSAFGIGGTNVHVVLEQAPASTQQSDLQQNNLPQNDVLLKLSARSAVALEAACSQLSDHLAAHPELALADVAHTLHAGRKRFAHRAVLAVTGRTASRYVSGEIVAARPVVAFLFPGQGAQHVEMGRLLYEREPVFRDTVDRCCARLTPLLDLDLRRLLYPDAAGETAAALQLGRTAITQPALFVTEYAMAQLWISRGVQPEAMLGHSIGEYVAACIAGVMTLDDALEVVAARGRLLQATLPGAMLAVALPESALHPWRVAGCDLAAVNAPDACVLSGPESAIDAAAKALASQGHAVRRLHVSHAFHSALVAPMLDQFAMVLSRIVLHAPQIPFISNASGDWITPAQATDPAYWVQHVRGTVRFADGLGVLLRQPHRILLEVGPGDTLSRLALRHPHGSQRPILASQCHPDRRLSNADQFARCLAQLWVAGVETAMPALSVADGRHRPRQVPLPTYPFQRQSYWIDPVTPMQAAVKNDRHAMGGMQDWFYVPVWKRINPPLPAAGNTADADAAAGAAIDRSVVLVLGHAHRLADRLLRRLEAAGRIAVWVECGPDYSRISARRYTVRPGDRSDYERLLYQVRSEAGPVANICHLWAFDPAPDTDALTAAPDTVLEHSFYSLLALAQALGATRLSGSSGGIGITVVANRLEDVSGTESLCPEKATLHGPCKVIPQEYPDIACRVVDVDFAAGGDGDAAQERFVEQVMAEMRDPNGPPLVAYRGPHRWSRDFETVRRDLPSYRRLRQRGAYLITGGLGGIGLALARHLALAWQPRLVLLGRTALPPRAQWTVLAGDARQSEALRATLQKLLELESLGAEVLTLQADVSDAVQLAAALEQARRQFGVLHGVIHAAGTAGGGLIAQRTRAEAAQVFSAKLAGTRVLLEALGDVALDFVVLCSSLTAATGGFGQVDYCAANCYLDAVAARASRQTGTPVLSVAWDAWREVGMAAAQTLPENAGISPAQGGVAFEKLLSAPLTAQTLVSTMPLALQFSRMQSLELAGILLPAAVAGRASQARPALATPYKAPVNELEQGLAALWSDFIGIALIGVDDSLFDLGGDSLLAIQLLSQVRKLYGVELHPAAFFNTPTIGCLAELVETRFIEEIENSDPVASGSGRLSEPA